MEIDQEIAVRAILVLANTRLGERGSAKRREAAIPERDHFGQRGFGRTPVLSIGIDYRAMHIVREFDAATFEIGETVEHVAVVEVGPTRHRAGRETRVASRRREEENLLAGGGDPLSNDVGEKLRKPLPGREDEAVRLNPAATAKNEVGKAWARRLNQGFDVAAA